MKIALESAIKQAPKKAIEGVNELGASTRGIIKDFGTVAQEGIDKFVKTKPGQGLKKAGVNKDTAIGLAVLAVAVGKAIQIGVGIKNKINQSKQTIKE